jgi:deoxycytidylate deaminase
VIETKHLLPYFGIASETAKQSPCTRRKYGAVIASTSSDIFYVAAANYGISKCCGGNICARDMYQVPHGQRVEVGAEIHAEQSALIQWKGYDTGPYSFVLAGWQGGKELLGTDVYPCHVCALMIKHAGFRHVYIKDTSKEIVPVSINIVIAYRELEWDTYDV